LASGIDQLGMLATDSDFVYWADVETDLGTGKVQKVPKEGGEVITLADGIWGPFGVVVASGDVFFTENPGGEYAGSLKKVPSEGGEITMVKENLTSPEELEIYGNDAYWTEYSGGAIRKAPIIGGHPITLSSSIYPVRDMAADSDNVYWTDWEAEKVKKVSVYGGRVTTLRDGVFDPWSISLDSGDVYFTSIDWEGPDSFALITRLPADGGNATTVRGGIVPGPAFSLAANSESVFWVEGNRIMKVSKSAFGQPSGTPVPSPSPTPDPDGPGWIYGYVYTLGGTVPVPGARVYTTGTADSENFTDSDGYYEIFGLPEGPYDVHTQAEGYLAGVSSVYVYPGTGDGVYITVFQSPTP
jgi:hypothetical protein